MVCCGIVWHGVQIVLFLVLGNDALRLKCVQYLFRILGFEIRNIAFTDISSDFKLIKVSVSQLLVD